MIAFNNVDIDVLLIDEDLISSWINDIVDIEKKLLGDLSFIFCSDIYLLKINKKYLSHDYFTDIITFNYNENQFLSGDIFISVDRVKENSKKYSISFNNELLRIIIHGVLHLLGYDDKIKSDKELMTSKEDEYLKLYSDVE